MRQILSLTLAVMMLFSVVSPVMAATEYEAAGKRLEALGIFKGDENGNLMLDRNLRRQDMVVLMSRLYGEEDYAKTYVNAVEAAAFINRQVFKDLQLNPGHLYYTPYLVWARTNNLIQGKANGEFGMDEDVTVQQFQTVLLRALGYTEEAKNWDAVPQLATQLGLMRGLNLSPSSYPNRGMIALMIENALGIQLKNSMDSLAVKLGLNPLAIEATALVSSDSVTFKGKVSGVSDLNILIRSKTNPANIIDLEITLEDDGSFEFVVEELEIGNYDFRYYTSSQSSAYKSFVISNVKFALKDVFADNLKEIRVEFNKAVNKPLASHILNYSTDAGSINKIRFEDSDKTVVLVLDGIMTNDEEYTLTAKGIKSVDGEVVDVNTVFGASDTKLPTVVPGGIEVLGNKGIRITFSEPIKPTVSMENFQMNVTSSLSNPVVNHNTITLSYSPSTAFLAPGNYSITIKDLEDYAGNKMNISYWPFVVVNDTTAPVVQGIAGTTEEITITFNEKIDPIAGFRENVYWMSGLSRRFADKVVIDGNKAIATFTTHPIPLVETPIFIENMVDYYGNQMPQRAVKVTVSVDTTKPEVLGAYLSTDGKSIMVTYNKNVIGNDKANYTIIDSTGRTATIASITGSGSEYTVNLNAALPMGNTVITIAGVRDSINQQISTFTTSYQMRDVIQPRLVNFSGYGNIIQLEFSKPMDRTTITDLNNYIMTFNNVESYLLRGTQFSFSEQDKVVTLTLPTNIEGKQTMIGAEGNLTKLNVVRLKDTSGNFTSPLILDIKFDTSSSGKAKVAQYDSRYGDYEAVLTEPGIVKLKFNMPIVKAQPTDFDVMGRKITNVVADGSNIVTIRFEDTANTTVVYGGGVVLQNNKIETSIGTGAEVGIFKIKDLASPTLLINEAFISGNNIEIFFTEELESDGSSLYRRDLIITRLSDGYVLANDEYSTSIKSTSRSVLVITIPNRPSPSRYSIRVVDNPIYIRDKAENFVVPNLQVNTNLAF